MRIKAHYALVAFSGAEKCIIILAKKLLTRKQLDILNHLNRLEEQTTATALVKNLSSYLNCSKSALWNSIRELRRCSLIECGDSVAKGTSIILTEYGYLVAKFIGGDRDEDYETG